jgi:hypothetical protein
MPEFSVNQEVISGSASAIELAVRKREMERSNTPALSAGIVKPVYANPHFFVKAG